jgi:hypothetical protein
MTSVMRIVSFSSIMPPVVGQGRHDVCTSKPAVHKNDSFNGPVNCCQPCIADYHPHPTPPLPSPAIGASQLHNQGKPCLLLTMAHLTHKGQLVGQHRDCSTVGLDCLRSPATHPDSGLRQQTKHPTWQPTKVCLHGCARWYPLA